MPHLQALYTNRDRSHYLTTPTYVNWQHTKSTHKETGLSICIFFLYSYTSGVFDIFYLIKQPYDGSQTNVYELRRKNQQTTVYPLGNWNGNCGWYYQFALQPRRHLWIGCQCNHQPRSNVLFLSAPYHQKITRSQWHRYKQMAKDSIC